MSSWRRTARSGLKAAARRIGLLEPPANYDVHLYETISRLRRWTDQDVIFDVGANDGRTILRLEKHLPPARIFAFEPVASTFATLQERTSHLSNVRYFPLALGAEPGEQTMYINESAAVNSLRPDWGSCQHTETIQMTTLDQFVEQNGLERIHLLKIDAEGHDLEVLKGGAETLSRSKVDMIEVEAGFSAPGRPQPSLEEFRILLADHGYHLYGIYNQCRGRRTSRRDGGQAPEILVYCDALFINVQSDLNA